MSAPCQGTAASKTPPLADRLKWCTANPLDQAWLVAKRRLSGRERLVTAPLKGSCHLIQMMHGMPPKRFAVTYQPLPVIRRGDRRGCNPPGKEVTSLMQAAAGGIVPTANHVQPLYRRAIQ